MTVFEKIKSFDFDEMSLFINDILNEIDTIDNLYCGYICKYSSLSDCFRWASECPLRQNELYAINHLLNMDYDIFRRICDGEKYSEINQNE